MKVLVLSSGGIDSTTCLALAVDKYRAENVISLSVFYNQKHEKELEAARKIAKYYNVVHKELNLGAVFADSDCTLLSGRDNIAHRDYAAQIKEQNGKPVTTYVPFRNGLFLSCAASIALANNCAEIYYGAHADDSAGNAYPDTSKAFNDAMNNAIYEGSGKQVKIVAPFINMNKADVVKKGIELGVKYAQTWSCYEGGEKPCGKCATCIDRIKAFEQNGITDPAEYEI